MLLRVINHNMHDGPTENKRSAASRTCQQNIRHDRFALTCFAVLNKKRNKNTQSANLFARLLVSTDKTHLPPRKATLMQRFDKDRVEWRAGGVVQL